MFSYVMPSFTYGNTKRFLTSAFCKNIYMVYKFYTTHYNPQ